MYLLNRLILIDSYKAGELVEVRLDGHTNLNGVNGAGKTTLLRLVPVKWRGKFTIKERRNLPSILASLLFLRYIQIYLTDKADAECGKTGSSFTRLSD
jgi:hypothetical protein